MAKKMAREAAFFVCALACGAEKWYDNYLRNVREVILYEIRYRRAFPPAKYLYKCPYISIF